jgi:hypothetical protein
MNVGPAGLPAVAAGTCAGRGAGASPAAAARTVPRSSRSHLLCLLVSDAVARPAPAHPPAGMISGVARADHPDRVTTARPPGPYRAPSGVFGVLATGFSVLLGFIAFLAFETYDGARAGAEVEALTVAQQVETAQFLHPRAGPDRPRPRRAGVIPTPLWLLLFFAFDALDGEQALAAGRTNAIRIQAARAASLAEAETQVDVATFTQACWGRPGRAAAPACSAAGWDANADSRTAI